MATDSHAETGLERLYVEHFDRIRGYLQRIVGDHAMAEDLAQDTFVKAIRRWDTREQTASAKAWVYRIATNTAYDELRRRRRGRVEPLVDSNLRYLNTPSFEAGIADVDAVRRALGSVPNVFREPLLLRIRDQQAVDEIAGRLEIAVGTVKSRIHRGRAHFRRAYDGAMSN